MVEQEDDEIKTVYCAGHFSLNGYQNTKEERENKTKLHLQEEQFDLDS